jgi:hypothetical protein
MVRVCQSVSQSVSHSRQVSVVCLKTAVRSVSCIQFPVFNPLTALFLKSCLMTRLVKNVKVMKGQMGVDV